MRFTFLHLIVGIVLTSQVVSGQQQRPPEPRSRGGDDVAKRVHCVDSPSDPYSEHDSMKRGRGGCARRVEYREKRTVMFRRRIERSGRFWRPASTFRLRANCERLTRKLGNALCAPIVKSYPRVITRRRADKATPGTISVREESTAPRGHRAQLAGTGFENVVFIGQRMVSGGPEGGGLRKRR